jgi:FkbH-like protein
VTVGTAQLSWLPDVPADFTRRLKELAPAAADFGTALQRLATARLNINQATSLGRRIEAQLSNGGKLNPFPSLKLAVLSNGTITLAAGAIQAAALRHGVATQVRCVEYELATNVALSGEPEMAAFAPDLVLLAFDYRGLPFDRMRAGEPAKPVVEEVIGHLRMLRDGIKRNFGVPVVFQTLATPPASLFGNFDVRLGGTWRSVISAVNAAIVELVEEGGYLLDVAGLVERVGSENWFDEPQWLAHKVSFQLDMAPAYADYVGRLVGAVRGRSRKCLVLDLDNTLWGGAIGDEGLSGIVLGQGSADGEAFLAVQRMALALRERGVALAVCSKNDDANARQPFRSHPDMLLKEEHISVFQANWVDKATNLEAIAKTLNIGLDALVFLDDNPAERGQVRMALPMVAIPEVGTDPSTYAWTIQAAGYFDAVSFSAEDKQRADQYAAEVQRVAVMSQARDLGDYLSELAMVIHFAPFDPIGRSRIAQLINKSNQFNLTSRRYTEAQVAAFEGDTAAYTMQVRLRDRFGDSGMIGVIVARPAEHAGEPAFDIDTWLMSCRVLGRKVEAAMLSELAQAARAGGARWLIGRYVPTAKNGMVREHYAKLGFTLVEELPSGECIWQLDLSAFSAEDLPMVVERVTKAAA